MTGPSFIERALLVILMVVALLVGLMVALALVLWGHPKLAVPLGALVVFAIAWAAITGYFRESAVPQTGPRGPLPPQHYNCRCVVIPINEGAPAATASAPTERKD